jgi:GNAT superfamily N-acetyltransferase
MKTVAVSTPGKAITLRDGSVVALRDADVNDESAVLELLRSLSIHAVSMRFGTVAVHLPSAACGAAAHPGVIAFTPDGHCVGHAWYVETMARRAEMALVVADRYHGRGLGTILVKRLTQMAALRGIDVLEAYVLLDNAPMTELLRDCGIPMRTRRDAGGTAFELDITPKIASAA